MSTFAIVVAALAGLGALNIIADAVRDLARSHADAKLAATGGLYCRAELESAVDAAVRRTEVYGLRLDAGRIPLEVREHIAENVLEDLDAGNLKPSEAVA